MSELYQNNGDISICFSADNNYVQHLSVAIVSMLSNTKTSKRINIYVLNDGSITEENKKRLEKVVMLKENAKLFFIPIDKKMFEDFYILPKSHFTLATYYRYVIPTMLDKLSKLIYLDCDLVVCGDIEELWNTDVGSKYIAAVPDILGRENIIRLGLDSEHYCNAGVLIMNLEKMRADDIQNELIKCTYEKRDMIRWLDQDVINMVLQNKMKYLDLSWNFQYFYDGSKADYTKEEVRNAAKNLKIFHYIGHIKPWDYSSHRPYSHLYFKYLKMTPWKNFCYKYALYSFIKSLLFVQNEGKYRRTSILGFSIKTKRKYFMLENEIKNLKEMFIIETKNKNKVKACN